MTLLSANLQKITSWADIDACLAAWQALYEEAIEAPISLCPNLALPLLYSQHSATHSYLLQSWSEEKLTGLGVFEQHYCRWGWPSKVLLSWQTPLTFSGTPLLAEQATVVDIATWLQAAKMPMLLFALPNTGYFWQHLSEAAELANVNIAVISTWERAALKPKADRENFETWYQHNFDNKRRKKYRRIRKRLGELGQLNSQCWTGDKSVQHWIDDFLALEARGWKGKCGTALALEHDKVACVSAVLDQLAGQQALRFWTLTLNGETIASLFAFVSGDQVSLAKITYDENYRKFSPGVLLILDATASLLEDEHIRFVDSCAIPDHPMINTIWRDRVVMADVLIGTPGLPLWRFSLMVKAEKYRRVIQEVTKNVVYFITSRHRS